MLEDRALENHIRTRIKNETINLPQSLNEKIKSITKGLPEKRVRRHSWFSTSSLIAAVTVIAFTLIVSAAYNKIGTNNNASIENKIVRHGSPVPDFSNIITPSNEELVCKFQSEGYLVESNSEEKSKMVGGYSFADRVRYYGSLEELTAAADIVIKGDVLAIRYFDHNKITYTESKIRMVKSYIGGFKAGDILTFCEAGGFTTRYNLIQYSGVKEKFGDEFTMTTEEEEKAKKERVFSSYFGAPVMQPGEKVVLFGVKGTFIDGEYFFQ